MLIKLAVVLRRVVNDIVIDIVVQIDDPVLVRPVRIGGDVGRHGEIDRRQKCAVVCTKITTGCCSDNKKRYIRRSIDSNYFVRRLLSKGVQRY